MPAVDVQFTHPHDKETRLESWSLVAVSYISVFDDRQTLSHCRGSYMDGIVHRKLQDNKYKYQNPFFVCYEYNTNFRLSQSLATDTLYPISVAHTLMGWSLEAPG